MLPPTMTRALAELLEVETSTAISVEMVGAKEGGTPPSVETVASTTFLSGLMIGLRLAQFDDAAARTWYEAIRANAWGGHGDEIAESDDVKVRAFAAAVTGRADG